MSNKYILAIIISVFFLSCNRGADNSSISGNISNLTSGTQLFLDYHTPTKATSIDTAIIDENGNYSFNSTIDKSGYYRLKVDNQSFISLVLEKGDSPIINGNGENIIEDYTIEGSSESDRFKEFQIVYARNNYILDSLQKRFQSNSNDPNIIAELNQSKYASINDMNNAYFRLINDKAGSLVSLLVVQQLDQKKYVEFYKQVDEGLTKSLPFDPWAVDFHEKVKNMDNLSVGKIAPDFTLNDPQGNPIALSSLKGKVVLIDFWASWCRPCRMENPNVVKAYDKYKTQVFDVLSVSLDGVPQQKRAKEDWIGAIKADGLIWKNHVSDLKGWNSSMVPLFGLKGIPFTLLIDADGKILGKNLRGEELEHKLASIFK